MASPSDFGFGPGSGSSARRARRNVEYTDESGLRRLPSEPAALGDFEDALDEPVELPGVHSRAALFGIGAGIGVAAFAITMGLYSLGWVRARTLNPPLPGESLKANLEPLEEARRAQALELARIAGADRHAPSASAPATQFESPDIQVIDQGPARPAPEAPASEPATMPGSDSTKQNGSLTDELDRLKRRLPAPAATAVPSEPSNDEAAPEREPAPPPAQPTAPAETADPDKPF